MHQNELVFKSSSEGVIGFLDGFYRQEYVHEDIQCYSAGVKEAGKFAMSGIKALKNKHMKRAIEDFNKTISTLNSTLKGCYESKHWEYMTKINKAALALIKDKELFVKTVKANSVKYAGAIGADITKIHHGKKKGDDRAIGIAVGDILHILMFGNKAGETEAVIETYARL